MINRSVRPGHNRDSATEPPLARDIIFRAKRPMISVEMRLRWATDTPCLDLGGIERILCESLLIRKRVQDTILKPRESTAQDENPVQNQDLTNRAA
jgi:hypothetical protein